MTNLIIAPHVDDEVLGCAAFLDKNAFVYFCGIDESRLPADPLHRIPLDERKRELAQVASFFGYAHEVNLGTKVNYYAVQELIGPLEALINKVRPDTILIPHPGYNQDHQTTYNACQVALRPHDVNFFVKRVLVYEAMHDFLWSHEPFVPNYYLGIDIERKREGYTLHQSQVRGMRSTEMLTTHARARGMMCKLEYAESYAVQRWVA